MHPKDFVSKFLPFALKVQDRTGISAVALLAQAALESGWGERAVGNALFGIKDTDGLNGNEQLVTTREVLSTPNRKFPKIISIKPIKVGDRIMYEYKVQDWFRKYNTPEGSFLDHAKFIQDQPIYNRAMDVRTNPYAFVNQLALAGYATAPNYAKVMKDMVDSIMRRMPK